MHMGTFNLEHGKVILGSFGALSQYWLVTKMDHHRARWMKIWALGGSM